MKDLFGKAMLDFYTNDNPQNIITETSISDADELDPAYLFRDFIDMPFIEQEALRLSFGTVLDVGCGAGSHTLYLENHEKLRVTAIDFSQNAIKTCQLRGLKNATVANFFTYESSIKFDTILFLMNGTGICGSITNLDSFLMKIKSLLSKNGQALIDSTDISYMYDKDSENKIILPFEMEYYGELKYYITYKNEKETPIDWLYLDFKTLQKYCKKTGLSCTKIVEGDNADYLAKITIS